jgi:alpha-L-fucosidase
VLQNLIAWNKISEERTLGGLAAMKMSRRRLLEAMCAASAGMLSSSSAKALEALSSGGAGALALAKPMIAGPFQPTWESLRDNYHSPEWLGQAKFGIFIHWGLYSIPAHGNEWYAKHMYTSDVAWHTEHYGAPSSFGYKDFIPQFTVKNFDPEAWAELFHESGARYVVPVAEHHDGFAMWKSDLTPWCAGRMGPKRDLIGELAASVRKRNLIFGCSFHRMEHHTFMYPAAGVANDQFDPRYAAFYGPPVPGEMNDGEASAAFQEDWLARAQELIDKYQPQLLYFDNGVNSRKYDGVKLRCAAYYYNRALEWREQAAIAAKDQAYLSGSVPDFEKSTRAPEWIYPGDWLVDDTIGTNSWGYVTGMRYRVQQGRRVAFEHFADGRRQHSGRTTSHSAPGWRLAIGLWRVHLRQPSVARLRRRSAGSGRAATDLEGWVDRRAVAPEGAPRRRAHGTGLSLHHQGKRSVCIRTSVA